MQLHLVLLQKILHSSRLSDRRACIFTPRNTASVSAGAMANKPASPSLFACRRAWQSLPLEPLYLPVTLHACSVLASAHPFRSGQFAGINHIVQRLRSASQPLVGWGSKGTTSAPTYRRWPLPAGGTSEIVPVKVPFQWPKKLVKRKGHAYDAAHGAILPLPPASGRCVHALTIKGGLPR
jgi:hypothetical protein